MSFTVGSVFSGIAGIDLGFERAGARVIWNCEIDAACRKVLRHHYPGIPRFKDVKTVTGQGLGAAGLRPDCLVGGFPCTDVSVAGKRAGLNGEQSSLFFEFARLLEEAQPQWFLIENVPGLLSSHGGWDFGTVLGTLADLGYGWAYRILDAQYFGVAQRRRRVFIVGCAGDAARAAEVLLVGEGGGGDPPARPAAGQEVAATLGGGSGARGWCDDTDRATFIPAVANTLGAGCTRVSTPGGGGMRNELDAMTYLPVAYRKATKAHHAEDWERWEETERSDTLTERDGTAPATVVAFQERGRDGGANLEHQDDLAYALTSPAGGGRAQERNICTPELAVRRLTPLECLRLQGFPDGWLDGLGLADSVKYRCIGNAVAVPVVEWIAKRMVTAA